jgi:1,4-alpha-glucan branching enzyme
MRSTLPEGAIKALVNGTHGRPLDVLGMHPVDGESPGVAIRTLQPFASKVEVLDGSGAHPMLRVDPGGLYEIVLPGRGPFAYRLRMTEKSGHTWEAEDPYRFPPRLTDYDIHLFHEGTNFRAYEKMGAHLATVDGVQGVHFAVWAPNAVRVSVVGNFNRWDGRHHPMQKRGDGGLWEIFVPGLAQGDIYKFEVKGPNNFLGLKADPYGFAAELRPQTASMIWDTGGYAWGDGAWMEQRASAPWLSRPVSVYEVHLGSWRRHEGDRWLTYRELADWLIPHVKKLNFTHIELLPISEHPFDGSWGYQTIGYYAPTSRFGTPDDLKYFIDCCHQEGIGVILDWVPAHFPKDGHGLAYFDGTHLYEHADPRLGEHKDWGTLIFNYGRNEVRSFLLSNAVYLANVFHVDGLRVDAVASMLYLDYSRKEGEWIPNRFGGRENLEAVDCLKKFNEVIHAEYPGILTFAEESTAWPNVSRPTYVGGLGFGLKWNMGWMHDTLEYFSKDPVYRKFHHNSLTFSMIYAFTENFILPFSHDEVVHGKGAMLSKMPGDLWQKFANLRCLYAYMYAHPGKKLLFMGGEFGQWNEWNCHASADWHLLQHESHHKLQTFVGELNRVYVRHPALHEIDFSWEGFEWIDLHDHEGSTLAFLRKGRDPLDVMVCVFNFTPVVRCGHRIGVPFAGTYDQAINSDAAAFGGSDAGTALDVAAEPLPWHGRPYSLSLVLPPLAGLFLRYRRPAPGAAAGSGAAEAAPGGAPVDPGAAPA